MQYYNKECQEINILEWEHLSEDYGYRLVKKDFFEGYEVSTVWIGIGAPSKQEGEKDIFSQQIFETMIFLQDGKRDYLYLDKKRKTYQRLQDALEGHEEACKLIEVSDFEQEGLDLLDRGSWEMGHKDSGPLWGS